ncbi:MAG TPA: metallopeptidase family protein [Thermoguttaceae bacterium]|nr:metallopeptidase family protein [Thermoguttaceae bacterium]
MDPRHRRHFDDLLEQVLEELPHMVHELIERVPLHVEDYPSREVLRETGIRRRDELCGLYTGIPLTERSVSQSGNLPDVVTIYREGILAAARGTGGRISIAELRRQIRITILHELAHHHGLDEDELRQLGYG